MDFRRRRRDRVGHRLSQRGSVLALICAMIAGITVLMLYFFLDMSRFMGSHGEQTSAIESAALAAAHDISNLVIDDPDLGFIGLSDKAPTGKATAAGDNYYLPVRGINSLIATARVDMIIADLLQDNTLKLCARRDYDTVMAGRARLVTALQNAIKPGGFGYDADGNVLKPVDDAITAYQKTPFRIARGSSKLITSSLKLSLGYVDGLVTNIQIPTPSQFANMQKSEQENLMYKAFVNIPYDQKDFVFAATGDNVTICDVRAFSSSNNSLPYQIPSIIKCEADQQYDELDQHGKKLTRIVHAAAAAEPSNNVDSAPNSGDLCLSFPNGSIPQISTLFQAMTNSQLAKSPADDTQTPLTGDFMPTALTEFAIPVLGGVHPPFGQVMRVALYDWISKAGYKINIQSLLTAFGVPLTLSSSSHADVFKVVNGIVTVSSIALPANTSLPVSNKQWFSVSGLTIQSASGSSYDVLVKDYTSQAGRTKGGIHAGQILGADANSSSGSPIPNGSKQIDENPLTISQFPTGPAGGAPRPTYLNDGIAAEIRFRLRK